MAINLGSAYGKVSIDSSGVRSGVNAAKMSLQELAQAGTRIGEVMANAGRAMTLGVTLPILAVGGAAIKAASDLQSSQEQVKTVFGQSSDAMLEWADSAATAFGRSKIQALDAASAFGMFFQGAGAGSQQSAEMSQRLVQLASDMALLKKRKPEDVLKAMQQALEGSNTALAEYGIQLGGIVGAQARYEAIIAQTAKVQGYFAGQTGNVAKEVAMMRAQLGNALAMLGQNLLPIVLKVVQGLNVLLERFNQLGPGGQKAVIALAGMAAMAGPLLSFLGTVLQIVSALAGMGVSFAGIGTVITGTVLPAIGALGAGLVGILGPLLLIIATVALVYLAFKNNFMGITTTAKQLWFILKWVFQQGWAWIVRSTGNAMTAIVNFIRKINLGELGKAIVMGIGNGIVGGINWVVDAVKRLAKAILDTMKRALGISSPSKMAMQIGMMTGQGYTLGLQRSMDPNEMARMVARPVTQINQGGNSTTVHLASGLTLRNARQMMQQERAETWRGLERVLG